MDIYIKIGLILLPFFLIVLLIIRKKVKNRKGQDIRQENHKQYIESLKEVSLPKNPPNIILVFTDDMGFADISCYGSESISTPNIDNLSEKGITFSHFYSSAPVCSASRAGILTGRYPVRAHVPGVFFPQKSIMGKIMKVFGVLSYGMEGISPDEITIAEVLQAVGYRTGILGKWHLGDHSPHLPNDKGFDLFYGSYYSNDMKPYAIYRNDVKEVPEPVDQNKMTKLLTKEAIDFIEENHNQPFFLHYCQPFPHDPVHASPDFTGKSLGGTYGDSVEEVDWSIGEIIKKLQKRNLLENTLIIFTSDNGPWHEGNPGYNRGRKGLTFEGGQKVPMIAHWPKMIKPGLTTDEISMNIDIFPTILNILDIPLPKDRIIDGKNILPLLSEPNACSPHEYLYYFWNKNVQAVRDSNWKFHIKKKHDVSTYFMQKIGPFLFDMKKDFNESYNQLTHHPKEGKRLMEQLDHMKKKISENLRGWN